MAAAKRDAAEQPDQCLFSRRRMGTTKTHALEQHGELRRMLEPVKS
jgi:hypothetical protein